MDIGRLKAAARRVLLADPGFAALIGTDVGTDAGYTNAYPDQAYSDGWVFQGIDADNRPMRDPANTGMSAVAISTRSAWAVANPHNNARFPQLVFTIWSDLSRDPADRAMILRRDAEARCSRVGDAIRDVFHDAANQRHWWATETDMPPDGVYVTSSLCGSELSMQDVPQSDGMVTGTIRFNLVTD